MRRQESGAGPSHSTPQAQHLARIICNSLWGQKLTFHPYTSGETPIPFSSLWPDKRTLVDTFSEAELNKRPFELCKLLLATNSFWCLEALLDERVSCQLVVCVCVRLRKGQLVVSVESWHEVYFLQALC